MNNLILEPILNQKGSWKSHFIQILIDGVMLKNIMKEIEMPMAEAEGHPSIAGGYGTAGVMMDTIKFFIGDEPFDFMDSPKTAILFAESNIEYDWPLLCHIAIEDEIVRWLDFEQPHRSSGSSIVPEYPGDFWDYSHFDGFVFYKQPYMDQVNQLFYKLDSFYEGKRDTYFY